MPINGKKIIVSVTTYPARINCLQTTLDSIFDQSLKADLVILYLSKEQFPNEQDELPECLIKLQEAGKLIIKFVPRDIRSHKKYFYAMQEYPNDLIVVIDDDLIYEKDMLLLLTESYKKHPNAVSAMRTHLILTEGEKFKGYYDWLFEAEGMIDKPSMQLYATNGAGTLYDPSLYRDDLYNEDAIMSTCLYADDMWMKANELIAGIPVVEVRGRYPLIYVDGSQEISPLLEINNVNKRNSQWAAIEKHFSNKYDEKNILFNRLKDAGIMTDEELLSFLLEERAKGRIREDEFYYGAENVRRENEDLKRKNGSKAYKLVDEILKPYRMLRNK